MTTVILVFVGAVCFVLAIVFAYDKKDKSVFDGFNQKVTEELAEVEENFKTTDTNIQTLGKSNEELKEIVTANDLRMKDLIKRQAELENEIESVQVHCEKLHHGQHALNDRISKKRPVIKMPSGPIAVEIYQQPSTYDPSNPPPKLQPLKKRGLGRGVAAVLGDSAK